MSYGTTTAGSGGDAVTTITYPGQMRVVYIAMLVLSAGLYLIGANELKSWENWLRAAVPPVAFVAWTMIQPSTAFDAFPFGLTGFARVMTAVFLAIILAGLTNWLAGRADRSTRPV
jgi:hypothetical protein